MKNKALLMTAAALVLSACSDSSITYPSPEGKAKPYVLKEDCKFTIVEELGSASTTSPRVTGSEGVTASASISLGEKSITVSNCAVTENSHFLPIYER